MDQDSEPDRFMVGITIKGSKSVNTNVEYKKKRIGMGRFSGCTQLMYICYMLLCLMVA